MKKSLFRSLLICAAALPMHSCSDFLSEYNPSAGDATINSFNVWRGLVVKCYSPLNDQLFSASDFMVVAESGTDLWLTANNKTNTQQLFYYEGLTTSTNATNKLFSQAYASITTCNAVINEAKGITDGHGKEADIKVLIAEAKCLRAYYYLLLTTYYGPVTLNLESAGGKPNLYPKRNSISEIYAQIIKDLKEASEDLGVQPYGNNYGRVSKKTALGLLARAYAQGAGENLTENGVSYWQRAKDISEYFIGNSENYDARIYSSVSELWSHKNNRGNKEALFFATGPQAGDSDAANFSVWNNKLFTFTFCNPNKCAELVTIADRSNYFYGRINNNLIAPSKYLMDCFDTSWDQRWEQSFTTAFANFSMQKVGWTPYNSSRVQITQAISDKYDINPQFIGEYYYPYADVDAIAATYGGNQYVASVWPKGDTSGSISVLQSTSNVYAHQYPIDEDENRFSIFLSKEDLSVEEKNKRKYYVVNINDLFDSEGKYLETAAQWEAKTGKNNNGYQLFPSLSKFNWSEYGMSLGSNLQVKSGDMFIMRMAEVYLIAAEAEAKLGNGAKAAEYLNVLRNRALKPGVPAQTLVSASLQDVLDEYAREMCGEFYRWQLLKRHRLFEEVLPKSNPRAAKGFNPNIHYNRPISYDFLSQIDNMEEYGDNGYGNTAQSGLNGFQ